MKGQFKKGFAQKHRGRTYVVKTVMLGCVKTLIRITQEKDKS